MTDDFSGPRDDYEVPRAPLRLSYWVSYPDFLAGAFPAVEDREETRARLKALAEAGIRTIINLTEPDEIQRYGPGTVDYKKLLSEIVAPDGSPLEMQRLSVPDFSTPTKAGMKEILDTIDSAIAAGNPVYVHCWGGHGRTGTVVGCYLARHGIAEGEEVIEHIMRLRRDTPDADYESPENPRQQDMVTGWKRGE